MVITPYKPPPFVFLSEEEKRRLYLNEERLVITPYKPPPFVFLSEEEKRRLYLNHVKPLKLPQLKHMVVSNRFIRVRVPAI